MTSMKNPNILPCCAGYGLHNERCTKQPLAVVVWKWGTLYSADHVNRFARMVNRNLKIDHRVICLTDRYASDLYDLDLGFITPHPMPSKHAATHRANRRVEILSAGWERLWGPRTLQLDLDAVILSDITDLCAMEPTTPAGIFGGDVAMYWHPGASYNPSFLFMRTGALDECWQAFDKAPVATFERALAAGWSRGCSDQAIINHYLCGPSKGSKVARGRAVKPLDHTDGIYAYKRMTEAQRLHPPADARIVFFTGKPAQDVLTRRAHHWIREALR